MHELLTLVQQREAGIDMIAHVGSFTRDAAPLPPSHVDVNRYIADLVRREIRLGLLPPWLVVARRA
ncbi:hypothetical protein [Rhodococcus triatomae]|nr:hypothetical protein G419_05075 [Rhodococcus triatomae BKS 15-14]